MSFQKIILVGNLGKDPEKRFTTDGKAITNFSLAVNKKYTGSDGETKEKVNWFNISVFGKQADSCEEYLKKGSMVLVEGEVQDPYAWASKEDGTPKATNQVTAHNVRFLNTQKKENNDDEECPF